MQKTILPRIYFLIENKKREFDSRMYFATKAASLGFSVVIAKKVQFWIIENISKEV